MNKDGEVFCALKIDMGSQIINMRDPIHLYRVRHVHHHQTGDKMVRLSDVKILRNCLSDAIWRSLTHAVCTLSSRYRPLYGLVLDTLKAALHNKIEFASFDLNYTVRASVSWSSCGWKTRTWLGWSADCRRFLVCVRRGYTALLSVIFAIVLVWQIWQYGWCRYVGNTLIREDLDAQCKSRQWLLPESIKVTLTNYPEGKEEIYGGYSPEKWRSGTRQVPFSKEFVTLTAADFAEVPPRKMEALTLESAVRLRGGLCHLPCGEAN